MPNAPEHADVLIIGAGPAGGVAAKRLAEDGVKVVALEQGHWQDPAAYRGPEWDWELAASKTWASHPNLRARPTDYPVDLTQSDMQIINFNGVGGGTILYNAVWIRLLEETFRERSLHGVADDWPITYQDLLPFYERTDRQFGVSGLGGNPAFPPGAEPPLPPLPFGEGSMKVARALHQKGWHWWPDTNSILSAPYEGRHQCVRRSACSTGCSEGAKSSADVTPWKKAVALGVRLVTGARVLRITLDAAGLANGAEWMDETGVVHFQSADVVLCAANGIGTPRLLLNSACPAFPDGLANRSGLVGRRLMLHPLAIAGGLFREDLESWQGHFGSTVQSLQFGMHDAARGFALGAKWSLHTMGAGPVGEAMNVLAEYGPGGDFQQHFAERFGHGMFWTVMCEDLPEESNRVVLSDTLTDSSGMPAPKLLYRYNEDSRRNLDFSIERAAENLREAGAWKVSVLNPAGGNAHFMGTARMGDDPKTSVVDRWNMSHDIPNLGILDASVFVTSGPGNPTSTLSALSLRASEHLLETRSSLPIPARRTSAPVQTPRPAPPPEPPAPTFSADERAWLKALSGAIITAGNGLPAASETDLAGATLDRILGVRPDLAAGLKQALAKPGGDPAARLGQLPAEDPLAYQALLTVVVNGYYQDPGVRDGIGYHGQEARPLKPDAYPAYVEEGLLDHLLAAE